MIDDSIVRGTTCRKIVNLLKDAGAKEVHVRVSSPPVKYSCYFGIDTPERTKLIAGTKTMDEIRELICADSLGYISNEGLLNTCKNGKREYCMACFNGKYPIDVNNKEEK
jgi:amidophosphoribosyltransferase